MAKQTANPHPNVMRSQSPDDWRIPAELRPDPTRAQSIATTPSPKQIRMNVPKNSAQRSPAVPLCQARGRLTAVSATATYPPLRRRSVQRLFFRVRPAWTYFRHNEETSQARGARVHEMREQERVSCAPGATHSMQTTCHRCHARSSDTRM